MQEVACARPRRCEKAGEGEELTQVIQEEKGARSVLAQNEASVGRWGGEGLTSCLLAKDLILESLGKVKAMF